MNYYDEFYKKSSTKFKKYDFHDHGKFANGEKPDFFEYVKKFANKKYTALDLGCGSGELTLKLAPLFKEIVGVDPFQDYVETAEKQRSEATIQNVVFQLADGKYLPFEDEHFDVIISSRGPLSADISFMKEGYRVLKRGGLMIEETIGERDKVELRKIFTRVPLNKEKETKLESVQKLLQQSGMELIESKYYVYYMAYQSIDDVVGLLERAPIIPHFDAVKDKKCLEEIATIIRHDGLLCSTHRLHWVAKK